MKILVTNAFTNRKWKEIYVHVVGHESSYVGNKTTLFNAIFHGLEHNTVVERLWVDRGATETELPVSIQSLPPKLTDLYLWHFDLHEDVSNNRKGLLELIQQHQHLKFLSLSRCRFCPKALGLALDDNGSLQYLEFCHCVGALKGFFDAITNTAIQELILWSSCDALGMSGMDAMHQAQKDKRMRFKRLKLDASLDKNEVHALSTMLADDTTIKELDLTAFDRLGED